ncbi:hypothetical protein HPB52_023416 [Rhipicephalus sanguineus]|uniref:SH3 domain-containing protein n=1 Tax=Rhipicephalus sanguineus TaxID=34632 RepID=A0A9D4PE02_RHISA|nr:hypothetical protein HPB52_023416 [Rhipicephalus sanguineus]
MECWVAVCSYQARRPDELSVTAGERFRVWPQQQVQPGWLLGCSLRTGAQGYLPAAYARPTGALDDSGYSEQAFEVAVVASWTGGVAAVAQGGKRVAIPPERGQPCWLAWARFHLWWQMMWRPLSASCQSPLGCTVAVSLHDDVARHPAWTVAI